MFAVILENLCSEAFKEGMGSEGGGVWKDAVSGFFSLSLSVCVCVYIYISKESCMQYLLPFLYFRKLS